MRERYLLKSWNYECLNNKVGWLKIERASELGAPAAAMPPRRRNQARRRPIAPSAQAVEAGAEAAAGELRLDIHEMFSHYNALYFNDSLSCCAVSWSSSTRYSTSSSPSSFVTLTLVTLISLRLPPVKEKFLWSFNTRVYDCYCQLESLASPRWSIVLLAQLVPLSFIVQLI